MSTAIKLTSKSLHKISDATGRPIRSLQDDLREADSLGETRYFVFDVTMDGVYYAWANLIEQEFFEYFDWVDPTRTDKICLA